MIKTHIKQIRLMDKSPRNDGLRPVQIIMEDKTYHFLKIEELKEILRLWIIGEEEKYPQPKFKGRGLLFDEIKGVFFDNDKIFGNFGEKNPMYFCLNCNKKYIGQRGFCCQKCHDEYYDEEEARG